MSGLDPDILDSAVLGFLLARHPGPVHVDELSHAFAGDDWATSVATLVADGVLHREGALCLVSRAAARTAALLG